MWGIVYSPSVDTCTKDHYMYKTYSRDFASRKFREYKTTEITQWSPGGLMFETDHCASL